MSVVIQPVILSGGSGTRLWPLSREHYPKQLLPLVNETTLLQDTALRIDALGADQSNTGIAVAAPIIICNEEHRFLIAEQLRQIKLRPKKIILEPIGRNTAPAMTLAALACQDNPDSLLLVMPADHAIADPTAFQQTVLSAAQLLQNVPAEKRGFVTFGIVPTAAHTGYGYIKRGAAVSHNHGYRLDQFVEKPDAQTAEKYLQSGQYYWNSGIFLVSGATWLHAIGRYQPAILASCTAAYDLGKKDLGFFRIDKEKFTQCPSDSIDYAVAEKITDDQDVVATVVPLDVGWSDIGAWAALWEIKTQDKNGNVLSGDTFSYNSKNNLISAESRLVATVGVEDMIIAETADAVLVARKDHSQDVKKVVDWLKAQQRPEQQTHRRVYRPWGWYESIDRGDRFQVKRIGVKPGAALSLQMHHHRAEHWIVVRGTAKVTRDADSFVISENESTYIPLGVTHRLENPGKMDLEIIEVQSGSYLGEDDIVRFDDQYGR